MPSQKQAGESKSPKRSVSRPRGGARGRPRKRSESPEAKRERSASRGRGRGRARKTETGTSPRPVSRSPSANRGRRVEETPRGGAAALYEGASIQRVAEVRVLKADALASSPRGGDACSSCCSALWSSFNLEFFGPLGALVLMITLPFCIAAANGICLFDSPASTKGECSLDNVFSPNNTRFRKLLLEAMTDYEGLAFLLFWLGLQGLFYLLPIGRVVEGFDPRERLRYRINLPHALLFTALLLLLDAFVLRFDVFTFVLKHYFSFIWWGTVVAFLGAFALFFAGRYERTNPAGNSGWLVHEFFMGRTRNPRIRSPKWLALFDFKTFFELRPGMLLWALTAISYLVVHYREVRALDTATVWYGVPEGFNWNLALLVLFQVLYVADASVFEEKVLSTFDIVTEGFGWMLLFGDMVFLPFLYSVNVRYLLAAHNSLSSTVQSPMLLAALTIINCTGHIIYRSANNLKHAFRINPNSPRFNNARSIAAAGGRKILISSWWSLSRHPNYVGDLVISLVWLILCGCPSNFGGAILVGFYPGFVFVLLLTRAVRDDAVRREKYGEAAWRRYCEAVKYRVIPFIF